MSIIELNEAARLFSIEEAEEAYFSFDEIDPETELSF
jgi:hypothetical protein